MKRSRESMGAVDLERLTAEGQTFSNAATLSNSCAIRPSILILSGVSRRIANHPFLSIFESVPEVGGPFLRRHYPASTVV